jgi:hypothetical protein
MRGRKLLINTMLKAKLIEGGIPELGRIVTTNVFQTVGMLIIQPQSQALKVRRSTRIRTRRKIKEFITI